MVIHGSLLILLKLKILSQALTYGRLSIAISGVTHGVSGVSLEECNRKLADATDGSIYVLIQPCSKA